MLSTLDEKLARLYHECRFLSGGYDRNPLFGEIVACGHEAVPQLLLDVAQDVEDSSVHFWVAIHLLRDIAGGDGPEIRPEDRGRFKEIRAMWLAWGRAKGLLA